MNFTTEDFANAERYSTKCLKRLYYNKLYEKFPHIASHILLKKNDNLLEADDFVFLKELETQLSCFNVADLKNKSCKHDDKPRYVRTGDESFRLTCGFGCYNLLDRKIDGKNNEVIELPPMYVKNSNLYIFDPSNYWFEFPIVRDKVVYTTRVNNFPVGFDLIDGYYKLNETYCKAYYGTYNRKKGECDSRVNVVLGFLLGETTLALIGLMSEGTTTQLRSYAKKPYPLLKIDTVEKWRKNIGEGKPEKVQEIPTKYYASLYGNVNVESISQELLEKVGSFAYGLMQSMKTSEFWKNLGISMASDKIITAIRSKITKTIVDFSIKKVTQSISRSAMQAGLKSTSMFILRNTITKALFSSIAKLTVQMNNVFTWILMVFSIVDLVLTIVDPLNLGSKMDDKALRGIQDKFNGEFMAKLGDEMVTNQIDVVTLCNMLLKPEDFDSISFQGSIFVYNYLTSLTHNSDGVRIVLDTVLLEDTNNFIKSNESYVMKTFDDTDSAEYGKRAQLSTVLFRIGIISLGLSVVSAILKVYILTIILICVLIVCILLSYLNIVYKVYNYNDFVQNFNLFKNEINKKG